MRDRARVAADKAYNARDPARWPASLHDPPYTSSQYVCGDINGMCDMIAVLVVVIFI